MGEEQKGAASQAALDLDVGLTGIRLRVGQELLDFLRGPAEGKTPGLIRRVLGRENEFLLERLVVLAAGKRLESEGSLFMDPNTVEGAILISVARKHIMRAQNLARIGLIAAEVGASRSMPSPARALASTGAQEGRLVDAGRDPAAATAASSAAFYDRFREYAGEVSDEGLQEVWARILAEHEATPGSVSLRALEVLRVLDGADADAFERIVPLVVSGFILPLGGAFEDGYESRGITQGLMSRLEDAGLLHGATMTFPAGNGVEQVYFTHGRLVIRREVGRSHVLQACRLTDVGVQLLRIPKAAPDREWSDLVVRWVSGGQSEMVTVHELADDEEVPSTGEGLAALFGDASPAD